MIRILIALIVGAGSMYAAFALELVPAKEAKPIWQRQASREISDAYT